MEVPLPSFFVSLVSWLGLIGGIGSLFERAETVASSQTKENVSRWLRSLNLSEFASEKGIRDISYLSPSIGLKKNLFLLKDYGLKLPTPIQGVPSAGIWFYSTFLTSCWVLLYAIAGLMIVVTRYLGKGIKRLAKFLDIDGKPIRSIGFMAMLFVTMIYLVLLMSNFIKLIVS